MTRRAGEADLGRAVRIVPPAPGAAATERARRVLERVLTGLPERVATRSAADALGRTLDPEAFAIELVLDPAPSDLADLAGPEAYRLALDPPGARLTARTEAGLAHAAITLGQWFALHARADGEGRLTAPAVLIEDAPHFPVRGFCLDVSRDRVPRLGELFALVDRLEAWKLNQLQLYTEHTFAYPGHELVWGASSAYAPDEIRSLDAYCRERGVELVPNQNCFGHLHRWLKHAPYRELAECPEGTQHPFLAPELRERGVREPWSLCPTDPRSLDFVAGLLDELLPCFTSRLVNVGCDETIDLGLGRSRAACEARGAGRVYADFVANIDALVRERDHRSLVWADVALRQGDSADTLGSGPDAGLPPEAIAVIWGYEADHPFEAQCAALAAAGQEFWVAPGTSSWNSLLGRLDNALANLANAARTGRAAGATGWLVTDWGDYGHWQPSPVSWPGLAAGAALGWNTEDDGWGDEGWGYPAARLAPHLVPTADPVRAAGLASALVELGRVASAAGPPPPNASAPFLELHHAATPDHARLASSSLECLHRTREALDRARSSLVGLSAHASDSGSPAELVLVTRELTWAGELADTGLAAGLARLGGADAASGRELAERVRAAARDLAPLWLERSRPGGLADSTDRLLAVARALETRGA